MSLHNFLKFDIQENYNNSGKSAIITLRRISCYDAATNSAYYSRDLRIRVVKKRGILRGLCPLRRGGRAQRSATAGGDFYLPVYVEVLVRICYILSMPSDKMSFVAKSLFLCNNIMKFDEQERHPALPKGNLI